jgi:hypothetical protein
MKEKMSKYLESTGITKKFLKRTGDVYDFYSGLLEEEILDIFVSDYVDGEGARHYDSLWLFSKNYVMEAKLFLVQDDFDFAPIRNLVQHWKIRKENYDFKKADKKSRMYLEVKLSSYLGCDLRASQENCDHLRSIFLKHIKSNLVSARQM